MCGHCRAGKGSRFRSTNWLLHKEMETIHPSTHTSITYRLRLQFRPSILTSTCASDRKQNAKPV